MVVYYKSGKKVEPLSQYVTVRILILHFVNARSRKSLKKLVFLGCIIKFADFSVREQKKILEIIRNKGTLLLST